MENISFTKKIKEELTKLELSIDSKKSLLASFFKVNGSYGIKDKKDYIVIKTEDASTAKLIFLLIKDIFPSFEINITYRKVMKFNKSIEYLISLFGDFSLIKEVLNIELLDNKISSSLVNSEEKIKGYFIGLFLSCGSCNSPKTSNYHLEFYFNNDNYANKVLKLTKRIKSYEFNFRVGKRKNKSIVYLKKSDQISMFLAFLDASMACIEFENIRVDRDFSNVSNRLINCDTYNYNKMILAAKEQLKWIEIIEKHMNIQEINNVKLVALMKIRKENKEASYSEIGELMQKELGQKVSKSSINHLFNKLKEMAHRYGF